MKNQENATKYYDNFSKIYDFVSSKRYYHKPRQYAIEQLELKEYQTVLNLPCGTGQNFSYFQNYLHQTGQIIGIDLSDGMLEKSQRKIKNHQWKNIKIIKADATKINSNWVREHLNEIKIDVILCDLGLSGFPDWQNVIDNLLDILTPNGKIVIMDWYIEKPSLRGEFIKWIGKGEVNRPIWQYLQTKVEQFKIRTFKQGDIFVASGRK
ncbi:MAG: class I SAM-dependent methyltransferase [Saprospiraceae bacterium]